MIRHHRLPWPRVLLVLALLAVVVGVLPDLTAKRVLATTGPSNYLPASKYKVSPRLQKLYVGQYRIASVAHGARILSGAMGIEISDTGYLYGVGQFGGYDASGYRYTWTSTMYNFHSTKQQAMVFDLLSASANLRLGRVFISRRLASGDLIGQIQLSNGQFAIRWHKYSSR